MAKGSAAEINLFTTTGLSSFRDETERVAMLPGVLLDDAEEGARGVRERSLAAEDKPQLALDLELGHGDRDERA